MRMWMLALLIACAGEAEPEVDDEVTEPAASCDASFPGPEMLDGTVESVDLATYEGLVADLDLTVAPTIDLDSIDDFQATVVNWMLGRRRGHKVTLEAAAKAGPLGDAVLAAIASGGGDAVDFELLRIGLQHTYLCSRPLPPDLDALIERYGDYTTWDMSDVPCGLPKDTQRRMYYEPAGRITVAETVEEGEVREIEVLFHDTRDDEQLDFGVYRARGALSNRSTFATRGGTPTTFGAPYICISCHTDNKINVNNPVGLGAGCVDM